MGLSNLRNVKKITDLVIGVRLWPVENYPRPQRS